MPKLKLPEFKFRILLLHRKTIVKGLMAMAIVVLAIMGTKPSVEAVFNQEESPSKRKLPIYCVDTDKPQIAISFDAAWGASVLGGVMTGKVMV